MSDSSKRSVSAPKQDASPENVSASQGTTRIGTGSEPAVDSAWIDGFPTVPGYEILEEVGRGGMGVVFKAKQLSLDRIVALKMIRDGALASEKQRSRFRTEAAAVARLQHPNIVQIFDLHEKGDAPFFSMELVEGENLAQLLQREKKLTPNRAATLLETLSQAVHYAHQQGIIHRDLKPANILLGKSTVKITDFGLARQLDVTHTPTLSVMGTPSYMAPEQAEGEAPTEPSLDVYSLGAMLYEMLSGSPPFEGETVISILDKVRYEMPRSLESVTPPIPPALQKICFRCLQKQPKDRYPDAAALAEDLQNFLAGRPLTEDQKPSSPPEKTLGDHKIEKELARGGLWVVYRAKDSEDRSVALKRIRPGSSPPQEQLSRLNATVQIAKKLSHDNLVPYLEVGGSGEDFYFTMSLIEGPTLEKSMKGKTMPSRKAAELIATLAGAVEHAHQTGLIHCHLDQSNVLLHEDKPTLIGFEMARRREDRKGSFDLETIRPSSHGMAPEQLFNRPAQIGPATDVYSLGVMLYELLTGQPPYKSTTTPELLLRVGFEILQPPHRINSNIPRPLSRICLKCMQVEVDKRYRSAAALAEDLQAFLEGKPTVAEGSSFWNRAWKWIRSWVNK